jgi:predicted DNA-binding transcriptional regulator AlpA
MPVHKPRSFHLDKRARSIANAGTGDGDELLTTDQVAEWFGVSCQWFEHRRNAGDGPPYERIARSIIRYRRSKVRAWLDARSHRSISEYRKAAT